MTYRRELAVPSRSLFNEGVDRPTDGGAGDFSVRDEAEDPIIKGFAVGGSENLGRSGKRDRSTGRGSDDCRGPAGRLGSGLRLADWRISAAGLPVCLLYGARCGM